MRAFAFLIAASTSLLLLAAPAKSEEAAQSPVGSWQSVDYVENIESFNPDKKSCQYELYLKEIKFLDGGRTSSTFLRWENDWLLHENGRTKAKYYIKQIGNSMYLFLPWLSGDVTDCGEKPRYYVLKKISDAKPEEAAQGPIGNWQGVDLVENIDNFKPEQKSWQGDLFLKEIKFLDGGRTSLGFHWEDGWLSSEDGKAKSQYYIKEIQGTTYLFLPWLNGDVIDRGQKPWYYVLKKVSDEKPEVSSQRGEIHIIERVNSVKEYDDVRWKDLSNLDLSREGRLIETLMFNRQTVWPPAEKRAKNIDPNKIMDNAMNPGLGVHKLHQQGITGKGVNVANIDQPLYQDHPEFAGKIAAYFDTGCKSESSMHGPAVASLLVGTNCGTAPDANLYYAAAPTWLKDASYYAKALDWIIEQNKKLPADQKIRVVSVSAAPSGEASPFEKNKQMWDQACLRAEAAGMLVLDCTSHHCFIGSCWYDPAWPEDVTRCTPGFPGRPPEFLKTQVLVPNSVRTTAEQDNKKEISYQYCGRGGLSWAIPYAAGVLAMGWQIRPDLDAKQMHNLLFQSAYTTKEGATIINPAEFIALVRKSPHAGKKSDGLTAVSQNPLGKWQTEDYVRQMNDFIPNVKTWNGEFLIKELEFMGGGKTSGMWTWRAGTLTHPGDKTIAKYVITEIDGTAYMFLESITGDVINRGQKPWYFVLKKVSGGQERPQKRR